MVAACSFGERMFFVYDREAVQKESDPPEDAILYFYPTSVSVDILRMILYRFAREYITV